MNLTIDIGNTLTKAAVFDKGQIVETFEYSAETGKSFAYSILESYPQIDRAIMVSVRRGATETENELKGRVKKLVVFDSTVPVPVKNLYRSPETLGYDRLAAAVGANALYPASDIMVADFGTAITIDVVTAKGEYLGGNISPGAWMRFRALHEYTDKLPLCDLTDNVHLTSATSAKAVESGVINGIIYEIEGYISRLSAVYPGLKIIFTGGDGIFFAKKLKNTIFVTNSLVAFGLNRILEYNAD